jgi:hypothetical protein
MELEGALQVLKRAIRKIREYEPGKVQEDLIVEGKNFKGWYVQAFKNKELDLNFFTGWIKINNVFEEFVKENKMESINGLNKILQELEDE